MMTRIHCACPTDDRYACIDIRYRRPRGATRGERDRGEEGCTCACHDEAETCPHCDELWWDCRCGEDE